MSSTRYKPKSPAAKELAKTTKVAKADNGWALTVTDAVEDAYIPGLTLDTMGYVTETTIFKLRREATEVSDTLLAHVDTVTAFGRLADSSPKVVALAALEQWAKELVG